MTATQKAQIDEMRHDGNGYIKISQTLGISENTVKSYCRRQKSASTAEMTRCAECGLPIDKSKRGNRRFCSDACRTKWWNRHPKETAQYTARCAYCGKEMKMRRKDERKYCSHQCYIAARYKGGDGNG